MAAIVAGWALAQQPILLPGLTIAQAASPHETLVLVVAAVVVGGTILFPSLALLFRLFLGGKLDDGPGEASPATVASALIPTIHSRNTTTRLAGACLVAGALLVVFANDWWAQAIGVLCLLAFVVLGFAAVGPAELAG